MEIEKAAGCSVQEIFENFGEDYFRKGEYRVIKRILNNKPAVLATGGGAYMNKETRKEISKYGIAIWLRADLDLLLKRTGNRSGRPLLEKGDKRKIIAGLIEERYPVYAESEFIIDVSDEPARETARKIIEAVISQAQRDKPKKKK